MSETNGGGTALAVSPAEGTMRLLQSALDKGVSVESLEVMVGLQERILDRLAAQEFAEALAAFQSEAPAITKNRTTKSGDRAGTGFGYAYATLDHIAEVVRPHLHRLGLAYSWDAGVSEGIVKVTCTLRHRNGHRETATFEAPVDKASKMNSTQQVGSALAYGKRYSLISVLGLTTCEDDTDANGRKGAASGTITEEQAANLEALIEETGADRTKFLALYGVAAVLDLPAANFTAAVRALEQKRRAGK